MSRSTMSSSKMSSSNPLSMKRHLFRSHGVTAAAVATVFSIGFSASTAAAYCRTTTCNPDLELDGDCGRTADGCVIKGVPLYWPDLCATFGVHYEGSKLRAIPYKRAEEVSRAAFREWISADCGNGTTPSIGIVPYGKIYCDKLEFNHDGADNGNAEGPNANLIVFRDATWPYNDETKTIALTTITFATKTGEILDADIEVNSANIELSTSGTLVTSDLQSILTHEIGLFVGLAHTNVGAASMNPDYDRGDLSFRTLHDDDERGICEIYPGTSEPIENCTGEEPRYGFSRYCGSADVADAGVLCSVTPALGRGSSKPNFASAWSWFGACAAGLFWWARRRR
jgi:hypothetical protein